ncbi:hypothetical protein LWH94_09420 [Marinobacter sp. G11]|uniref:hypothetical protein n=1 Tax=Marinobacter sp. G11 TaxID=2903522 RepID=UPI001E3C6964|nr:hypothetical protein [Marinobacter sp. G11]MCE0759423.1 hypothetical protein [Marinobacter sp. G11]
MTSTLRILNGLSYVALLLLVLSGLLLFSEGVRFGLVLIAVPGILMVMRMGKMIVKSGLAIGVVLFGLGLLEIHYGIAKTMPVSWVVGCAGGVIWLVYKVIGAMAAWFMADFKRGPNGEIPFPELKGSNANFTHTYRGHGFSANAGRENGQAHNDGASIYKKYHHFDGPNPFVSDENLTGKFF